MKQLSRWAVGSWGVTVTLHNRVSFTTSEVRRQPVELECRILTSPIPCMSPRSWLQSSSRLHRGRWRVWQDALCLFRRWVFIYEKGYQSTDTAVSSVFSKMKGVGYTNVNGSERVWDVADYVFPSQVGWSVCFGQLGPVGEARTLNVFVTRPLIGQRFACRLLRVTVTAGDGTAVNLGQTQRQRNHESNCPRE